eukprot:121607-Prorocentrum_lima.AAC.1
MEAAVPQRALFLSRCSPPLDKDVAERAPEASRRDPLWHADRSLAFGVEGLPWPLSVPVEMELP